MPTVCIQFTHVAGVENGLLTQNFSAGDLLDCEASCCVLFFGREVSDDIVLTVFGFDMCIV